MLLVLMAPSSSLQIDHAAGYQMLSLTLHLTLLTNVFNSGMVHGKCMIITLYILHEQHHALMLLCLTYQQNAMAVDIVEHNHLNQTPQSCNDGRFQPTFQTLTV